MRKSAWYVPFLALALATSAYAQGKGVETCKDRQDTTVKVMVCVDADVDWVYRSKGLRTVLGSAENAFEYNFSLSWHIDMTDKVSVFASLAIPRNPSAATRSRLGDGTAGDFPTLYDLNVKIMEVWDPAITLSIGTQNDLVFSIRANGQSLFFAPAQSNRFGDHASAGAASFESSPASHQVTGIVGWYKREAVQLAVCILPAIFDGNSYDTDESAYALFLYYDLATVGKGSRLGFIVSSNKFSDGTSTRGKTLSFGGGASLKDLAMPGSEIFVEFYVNSGDADDTTSTTVKSKGLAFVVGFKYVLPNNDAGAWAEISFTSMSGEDGSDADSDYYLSYSNVADLVILEDQTFGIHVNTNATIIKIMGGMGFTAGTGAKNNVQLKVAIGMATAAEDIGTEDGIGTEIDVRLTYWYSKAVSIDIVVATLSSDVLDAATGEKSSSVIALGIAVKG